MDFKKWEKANVEEHEVPEDVVKGILMNALVSAYLHHENCNNGDGIEAGKVYRDMFDLICDGKVDFIIKKANPTQISGEGNLICDGKVDFIIKE